MKELNYLTDDEVMQLMESVENDSMISAPGYLKDNILQNLKEPAKKETKKHEMLFFSTKIVAAAAAAIALLITMPKAEQFEQFSQNNVMVQQNMVHHPKKDSLFWKLNSKTNQLYENLSDSTNSIFYKGGFFNDK